MLFVTSAINSLLYFITAFAAARYENSIMTSSSGGKGRLRCLAPALVRPSPPHRAALAPGLSAGRGLTSLAVCHELLPCPSSLPPHGANPHCRQRTGLFSRGL